VWDAGLVSDKNELGDFLRSRRERVDAQDAGVIDTTRRRVTGLRREELALLAGLSASYYARLEQGRDRNPSPEVLEALAAALRLDAAERRYLQTLALPSLDTSGGGVDGSTVRSGVQQLFRRWVGLPAFVVTPSRDVVAATSLARRVNPAWAEGMNLVRFTFTDPRARATYPDWADIAAQAVAGLRASAADHPQMVEPLVDEMRHSSDAFRQLWDRRDVLTRTVGIKRIRIADVGIVGLDYETFTVSGSEGQALYVYFPPEGSESERVLESVTSRPGG